MADHLIECGDFARALSVSAEHLNINLEVLDNLNVFPVPDGDTGANMAATFLPAVEELQEQSLSSCFQIGEVLVPRMNSHSRGNSGFIISRFFKGFFSSMEHDSSLTVEYLKTGFSKGYFEVHTALFNPVEGTMISVISSMSRATDHWKNSSVRECLEEAVVSARKTLFETPSMLPVLARAGVVDSGALGFICLIEGLLLGLNSRAPFLEQEDEYRFDPDPGAGEGEKEPLSGQYCTELVLEPDHEIPENEIRNYLMEMGNSIALVAEDDFVKLHIHTDFPEQVINKFGQYGTIVNTKVDDIFAQIKGAVGSGRAFQGCEVIPCVPGEGFASVFHDLGIENVLVYGNSLPSVIEILSVVEKAGVDDIILLPNDRNILPACMTVKERSKKHISILPAGNVIQGIAACYGFSENEDLETNAVSMHECMDMAEALFLYRSNADRTFGAVEIKKDDFFLSRDKDILSVDTGLAGAVIKGLEKFDLSEKGNITVYHRDDFPIEELDELKKLTGEKYPHIEVDVFPGGQGRGELIISLE